MRPSGNTPPSNYTKPDESLLSAGIDSAYIGYYGTIQEGLLNAIYAGEKVVRLGEFELKVGTTKTGTYRFSLDNEYLHILLANTAASSSPAVMVQMKSVFIWSRGFPQAYSEVITLLDSIFKYGIEGEKVSRVDLCADFDWQEGFTVEDGAKFITRADVVTRGKPGRLKGFEIGTGKFRTIIYNKSLEIRKSHKQWFYELWGGEYQNVWRVEFRFRREMLKKLNIETVADLLSNIQRLWDFACHRCLTMREGENKNVSQRPLTEFWKQVQGVKISFEISTVNVASFKAKEFLYDEEHGSKVIAGIANGIARKKGIQDAEIVFNRMLPLARPHLKK